MSPRRLSARETSGISITFDAAVSVNSEITSLAMQFIGRVAWIESAKTTLLTRMFGVKFSALSALFEDLIGSDKRSSAVKVAARELLEEEDFDLIEALFARVSDATKNRDRLCHYLWCSHPKYPGALVLMQPKDYAPLIAPIHERLSGAYSSIWAAAKESEAKAMEAMRQSVGGAGSTRKREPAVVWLFELEKIKNLISEAEKTYRALNSAGWLLGAPIPRSEWRESLYESLPSLRPPQVP